MEQKNIKLGIDVKSKNHKFKAVYAIRELRRQIQKHFKNVNFRIDNSLNEYFWNEGKTDAPTKVEITAVKDGSKLIAFLANSDNLNAYLNKGKEEKKADVKPEAKSASKAENEEKKEDKKSKSEPKVEKKAVEKKSTKKSE